MKKIFLILLAFLSCAFISYAQMGSGPFGDSGSGDMKQSVYDTDLNNKADFADEVLSSGINWTDLEEITSANINWTNIEVVQPMADKSIQFSEVVVGGSGQSSLDHGLVVNESGGSSSTDNFRAETSNESNFFIIDAANDVARFGDYSTNYMQVNNQGYVQFAGSGGINWDSIEGLSSDNINWTDFYVQGENVNWDSVEDNIGDQQINWTDIEQISSDNINWTDIQQIISFALEAPTDDDSILFWKSPCNGTITDIHCISKEGTSTVIDVQECASDGTSCSTVDATITCDTDGAEDDGSLSNGTFDALDWLNLDIGTVTGNVNWVTVDVFYER